MKEHLLSTLENSREYTLAVAEAMPENDYIWKPNSRVWNFGELLCHIAYGIHWWEYNYIKGEKMDWAPPAAEDSKDKVLKYIHQSYNSLKDTIDNASVTNEVTAGFYATLDHITHHRGQAIAYLQSKNIAPPEYKY